MVSDGRDRGNPRQRPYPRGDRPARGWTRDTGGLLIDAHVRGAKRASRAALARGRTEITAVGARARAVDEPRGD
jgi:hypothetical protein